MICPNNGLNELNFTTESLADKRRNGSSILNKRQKDCLWKQRTHYKKKMGVSVLFEPYISSNEVCKTKVNPVWKFLFFLSL